MSDKVTAFVWTLLAWMGLDDKVERVARGETVFLDGVMLSMPARLPKIAAQPGANRGQLGLGTILAAFVVVIATFVVLIVVDQFEQSLGTPSSSSLSTAENDVLSGFGSMVSLVEPLLLIAIGVVIIGLIRRVQ